VTAKKDEKTTEQPTPAAENPTPAKGDENPKSAGKTTTEEKKTEEAKQEGPEFEDERAEGYTAQADPIVTDSFIAQIINTELEGGGDSPTLETLRENARQEWKKQHQES